MDVMHNQSANQDLLCCRACLATGCRLYNIHANKLADVFSRMSGIPVFKDEFPQYLCSYCCCMLLKCASFRAKCLETQKRLILELINGELNTDSILRLCDPTRRLNLTLSVVNVVECIQPPTIDIKQEPDDVINTDEPAIDTAVKCERDIDEGNLSQTRMGDVNLGESNIEDVNLSEHIDNECIDTVDVHSNKQNTNTKKKSDTKSNEVKMYDNVANYDEDRLLVNKAKTTKTYKKKIGITTKKKLIKFIRHRHVANRKIAQNDDISLRETRIDKINLSEPQIDDINLRDPLLDVINLTEPQDTDDIHLSEPHIEDSNLSEPHVDDNLSEPHKDDNLSEPHKDDNLSDPYIDDNVSKPHIDKINLSEPHIHDINLQDPFIDVINLTEPQDTYDIHLSEPHIDDSNLSEPHIDDSNLSDPYIDDNVTKPHIEDNLSEPHIDVIKLSERHIVDVHKNKRKANFKKKPVNKKIKSHTVKSNDNKTDTVKSNENTEIDDEDICLLNKVKTIKTYTKKIGTTTKKQMVEIQEYSDKVNDEIGTTTKKQMVEVQEYSDKVNDDIGTTTKKQMVEIQEYSDKGNAEIGITTKKQMVEVQEYSDKVNDEIDKNQANIDLKEIDLDKIKRKINVTYSNPDLAEVESDIDDINEIKKPRIKIVSIERIMKGAAKKPKTTVKKKKSVNAVKPVKISDNAVKPVKISDNAVKPVKLSDNPVEPVKRGRRKKKRKFRNPENDYLPEFDFSEFERKYDFKIVILSKQEQLEEIVARKQTKNYTESRYKCEDCGRYLEMEAAFKNHRRRHSTAWGPELCSICSLRHRRRQSRVVHEDTHRLKFICQACGEVTRNRSLAKAHHEFHEGIGFACKYCDKQFRKRSTCLSHVRMTHPDLNVNCDICGESFVSDAGLRFHKSLTHPETITQLFKCKTCSARFVSLDALDRHTDSGEHAGWPCEQCGESCASGEALRAHARERHPSESHYCEECCASFSNSAAFDVHFQRKHLNKRAKTAPRPQKRASHKTSHNASRNASHKASHKASHNARPHRDQLLMCEQCGYLAPSPAALRIHQNRHLAVKPYPCPLCPKTFPTKHDMKWHIYLHTGEKPFKCPECPMTFRSLGNQQRHHKVVHLRIHAFACHICGRVFTTKSSMQMHVNTVHNGQPWPRRNRKRKRAS